jgi:glycerol-3-phosphate acyltransferase PlsY
MTAAWIGSLVAAYLVGAIPFGVLIARTRGVDIRAHGSRNIGASNVYRVLGRKLGLLTFSLDMAKGAVTVIVTGILFDLLGGRPAGDGPDVTVLTTAQLSLWLAVAAAAVLGHMFSPFLGFRGGKGVATGFGALVSMWNILTLPALVAVVVWYGMLRLTLYISVASITAAASLPVSYLLSVIPNDAFEQPLSHTLAHLKAASPPLIMTTLMAALVLYMHRGNIARLRRGEEPKVRGQERRGKVI